MDKEAVLKKLDVNGDGSYNLDDIIALAKGEAKKAFFIGLAIGAVLGAFVVRVLVMF